MSTVSVLKLDIEIPYNSKMKSISWFTGGNFFDGAPDISSNYAAGFMLGEENSLPQTNFYNLEAPGVIHGEVAQSSGYSNLNKDNYIDTLIPASGYGIFALSLLMPNVPSQSLWALSSFTSSGTTGNGIALGFGSNGDIRFILQNPGSTSLKSANIPKPSWVSIGDRISIAGVVSSTEIALYIYNEELSSVTKASVTPISGGIIDNGKTILLGAKHDTNLESSFVSERVCMVSFGEFSNDNILNLLKFIHTL